MKFTEKQLKLYAAPLSETENQKCLNAIGMVRDALKDLGFTDDGKAISKMYDDTYAYALELRSTSGTRKVRLFIQGSYANVRIVKKMRYIMNDSGYKEADQVSSFGLESLLWNLPDDLFMKYSIYRYEFGEIVEYLYKHKEEIGNYKEANGIKPLCPTSADIINYKNFVDKLYLFYDYDITEEV